MKEILHVELYFRLETSPVSNFVSSQETDSTNKLNKISCHTRYGIRARYIRKDHNFLKTLFAVESFCQ